MKSFLNRLKLKWPCLLILLLVWIALLIILRPFEKKMIIQTQDYHGTDVLSTLQKGSVVEQDFIADHDNFTSISIYLGNGSLTPESHFRLTVKDIEKDTNLLETEISSSKIKTDASFYQYSFEPQEKSNGKTYRIIIEGLDGNAENSVILISGRYNGYTTGFFTVNGDPSGNYMVFKTGYQVPSMYLLGPLLLLLIISILLVLWGIKPDEFGFLKIALCLGIFCVVVSSFPNKIDESTHFFRSYNLAQGDIEDTISEGRIGEYVSDNYDNIVENGFTFNSLYGYSNSADEAFSPAEEFYANEYMSSSISLAYVPTAIGLFIGKHLGLDANIVVYLARLINFLVYVLIMFAAIRILPCYKRIFFWVGVCSNALWLAGSFSYDALLLSCSTLLISICLKYYLSDDDSKNVSVPDIVVMLMCVVLIASVKDFVYAPILLFFFIIPIKKFGSRKNWFIVFGIAVLLLGAISAYQVSLLNKFPFTEDRNGKVDLALQLKYISGNFGTTIINFANHFIRLLPTRITYMYNAVFLYDGINDVAPIAGLFGIFTLFVGVTEDAGQITDCRKTKKIAVFSAIISVIVVLLIMLSLYLSFTPVGSIGIDGIQERYYLPILALMLILLSRIPIVSKFKKDSDLLGTVAIASMLTILVKTLCCLYV